MPPQRDMQNRAYATGESHLEFAISGSGQVNQSNFMGVHFKLYFIEGNQPKQGDTTVLFHLEQGMVRS